MEARISRALTQRLHLLEVVVPTPWSPPGHPERLGTYRVTGLSDVYTVHMGVNSLHTCTCPDYSGRQEPCKHIFFILFRVMNIDVQTWLDGADNGHVDTPVQAIARRESCDKCAICLETWSGRVPNEATRVCHQCRNALHMSCWNVWSQYGRGCPSCHT
jgi:hypothetical protein